MTHEQPCAAEALAEAGSEGALSDSSGRERANLLRMVSVDLASPRVLHLRFAFE